jgi:hypothetical protein
MMAWIKSFIMRHKLLRILAIPVSLLKKIYIISIQKGHLKSYIQYQSVDRNNNPLPWYTYSSIDYLSTLDFSDSQIFEFGSGNSSFWWAKRAKEVTSVEDNYDWFNFVYSKILANQKLIFAKSKEEYLNCLKSIPNKFDVIIVDGNHRLECCEIAINRIENNGIIILDNTDVEKDSVEFLKNANYSQILFTGFAPIIDQISETSLFIKIPISRKI